MALHIIAAYEQIVYIIFHRFDSGGIFWKRKKEEKGNTGELPEMDAEVH